MDPEKSSQVPKVALFHIGKHPEKEGGGGAAVSLPSRIWATQLPDSPDPSTQTSPDGDLRPAEIRVKPCSSAITGSGGLPSADRLNASIHTSVNPGEIAGAQTTGRAAATPATTVMDRGRLVAGCNSG